MSCDKRQCLEVARSCAVFNLRRAARAATSRYEEDMRALDLKATQFSLLVATALYEPVNISELAGLMVMDRTTLTRNLKPLQKRGLLQVLPGADRRTRAVSLTADGDAILEQALPLWERAQREVVDGLGQQRFDGLLRDLKQTVDVVRGEAEVKRG